ncbi:hypothetical protein NPIL_658421 [Nephila pilipes]|uniref:Uncharacterized protein n=1 Tax=Nephila pilipes TaxID=299642 RepID=A0A8X6TRE1_NEPPI|nr:hypothetical protein NPIL_658421 [Nephila pilipes]
MLTKSVTKHTSRRKGEGRKVPMFCFPSTWSVKHPETATSLSTDAGPATMQYLGMPRQSEGELLRLGSSCSVSRGERKCLFQGQTPSPRISLLSLATTRGEALPRKSGALRAILGLDRAP